MYTMDMLTSYLCYHAYMFLYFRGLGDCTIYREMGNATFWVWPFSIWVPAPSSD